MQFRDLKQQYQHLKQDIDCAVLDVMQSGAFIMGQPVKELERQLADYVGVKHCLTCANGTDALTLALKAWGIGKGDAVFVPDFTFFASAEVVALEGATPIFVDVDADTFNISPINLERTIEAVIQDGRLTPKVIIAVDLFGLPADYPAIRKIADKYHLYILEDGAQGFGGSINGKRACSFGDIATTSFFPAKPLGCYGDGGAVFTDNDEWAALIDSYRVHGKGSFKYDNVRIGMNSRLDTIQAAILQVKLKAFQDYELEAVNKVAEQYTELFSGIEGIKTPVTPDGFGSSWAQYTIQLPTKEQRDALQAALKAQGIPSMVYYPKPMHLQTAFKSLLTIHHSCVPSVASEQSSSAPFTAVSLSETVLSLPMHPYLCDEEIMEIVKAIITTIKL